MDERKQQRKTRLKQACSTTCTGTNMGTAVFEPAGTTAFMRSRAHAHRMLWCVGTAYRIPSETSHVSQPRSPNAAAVLASVRLILTALVAVPSPLPGPPVSLQ